MIYTYISFKVIIQKTVQANCNKDFISGLMSEVGSRDEGVCVCVCVCVCNKNECLKYVNPIINKITTLPPLEF